MQNYNDILNGVTDGTKDITVNAITANGAVSFKGTVTLGDATADDITVTGSLASTINIKTTNTYNIGSATLGLAGIYLGTGSTQTARIVSTGTLASSRTYTLLDAGAAANFVLSEGAATINGLKTLVTGMQLGTASATYALSTLVYYQEVGSTTLPTLVWDTGDPTTITVNKYAWSRIGNIVTVTWRAVYSGAGTLCNNVYWALPSTMPLPLSIGNADATFVAYGAGYIHTAAGTLPLSDYIAAIYQVTAGSSYRFYVGSAAATGVSAKGVYATLTYICA